MIIDTFKNFNPDLYSEEISYGVKVLSELSSGKEEGIYQLRENIKLIIESYNIRHESLSESLFEVHDYTLDIQYPLQGYEMTYFTPLCKLSSPTEYDVSKDRTHYKYNDGEVSQIITGSEAFAIYYPGDPHSPKNAYPDKEILIKKATVKIILDN